MNRTLVFVLVLQSCGLPFVAPRVFVEPRRATTPIEVCWLETGGRVASAGFGAAGLTRASRWDVTTSAILVRHPKGDVLIDTGLGDLSHDSEGFSAWGRFVFDHTAGTNEPRGTLRAMLDQLKVGQPVGIILSHAHADHAGGVSQLPGVPVWLAKEEIELVTTNLEHGPVVSPRQAQALQGREVPIPFAPVPYALFGSSFDVFGDGSVVVVPTFGHTPGSVSTFVDLGDRRFMHVGDLISLQESIDRAVPKSALMRALTDVDPAATDAQVATLVRLQQADPRLWVLPAHDRAAWEALFGAHAIGAPPPCIRSRESQ
jgi:N-acyl homoserine lactone hydrolase